MSGIPVTVIYDPDGANTDITSHVIFSSVSLQTAASAQNGTWQATVKDVDRNMSFVTGKRIVWYLDNQVIYGGFITQISRTFALPADNTNPITRVKTRQFILRGADYNLLLDKRVFRVTTAYTTAAPVRARAQSQTIISQLCGTYLDTPTWLDYTTAVDDVSYHPQSATNPATGETQYFGWVGQGSTWRSQMDILAGEGGAIYYIRPTATGARLVFRAYEDAVYAYTFSDKPEAGELGFRELDYLEDATGVVNDALVWGGSALSADGDDNTKFHREQNATSITDHNRWQWAETHFGDSKYATQEEVTKRAEVIVKGRTGDTIAETNRGLQRPNKNYTISFYHRSLPFVGGSWKIPKPGDLTTLKLHVFGSGSPVIEILPLRSMNISFPTNATDGSSFVKFTGTFSLQANDHWSIWQAIRSRRKEILGNKP